MNVFKSMKYLIVLMLPVIFFSCSDDDNKSDKVVYEVKGFVADATTEAPVLGVRAVLAETYMRPLPDSQKSALNKVSAENDKNNFVYVGVDTVFADKKGNFILKGNKNPFKPYVLNLIVRLEDMDNIYKSIDKPVIFEAPITYSGKIVCDMGKVVMTKLEK